MRDSAGAEDSTDEHSQEAPQDHHGATEDAARLEEDSPDERRQKDLQDDDD